MVPFLVESPGISRNNNIVIKQIRVYNGGGTLGSEMGCWPGGIRFGDAGSWDDAYLSKRGGLISGIAFLYSDGTEQSVGSVLTDDGIFVDTYDFQDGERLAEYSVATTVNPNGYWAKDRHDLDWLDIPGHIINGGSALLYYETSGDNGAGSPWNQVGCVPAEVSKAFLFLSLAG